MKLPHIPVVPRLELPHQVVIPAETLTTFWAVTNIALGFIYLLFGLRIFRVMTTITAVLWGAALGMMYGYLIESMMVAMLFCSACLGVATWLYTRWMVAIPFALVAAALGWQTAKVNGAPPLAAFFIALASAFAIGGPIWAFYRTVVTALTCIQGAVLVVFGTAIAILVYRHKPLAFLQDNLDSGVHILLAGVCILLLAIPAFYFQRQRYADLVAEGKDYDDSLSLRESAPKKKAA